MAEQTQKKISIAMMAQCGLFVALIAAGAFIRVPVPVVPFTLQVLFTNLAGLLLGKKYGAISVVIYILIGLAGIPIFTGGGGFSYVLHPTFGYMIGMVAGTYLGGMVREKTGEFSFKTTFVAGIVNIVTIYIIGLPYFIFIMNFYLDSNMAIGALLISGFVLTLPGDIIKCIVSSLLAGRIGNYIQR